MYSRDRGLCSAVMVPNLLRRELGWNQRGMARFLYVFFIGQENASSTGLGSKVLWVNGAKARQICGKQREIATFLKDGGLSSITSRKTGVSS